MTPLSLPIEDVLATEAAGGGASIGTSREGRPITGWRLGTGSLSVSLIGGCHADEPVGPAMLTQLVGWLRSLEADNPLLTELRWTIVPHVNPDGAERNRAWSDVPIGTTDHLGEPDAAYDLATYARSVVREPPGEDIEFGFPRDPEDAGARPENLAVAAVLRDAAPLHLHASFHGMAWAPGPWFLIDRSWIDRTAAMRQALRRTVRAMGYGLLDWDRRGDKGFERIDEGFSTRPDSGAMREHFLSRGDARTAALFRPSSMELARTLGDDPLTFVSEMPLFLNPDAGALAAGRAGFRERLRHLASLPPDAATAEAERLGVRPMPIRDQMRLQLAFLREALDAVWSATTPSA